MKIRLLKYMPFLLRRDRKEIRKVKSDNETVSKFNHIKVESEKNNRGFKIEWSDRYLFLNDATSITKFDAHYVYHIAWAIRKIKDINPNSHIDISSSLYFCANLSAIIPTAFYDYRPAPLNLSNLTCDKANLTGLPFDSGSIDSLSCMHTVEHVGLGRYGDEIDSNGDIKAIDELKRVLKPGGHLVFVVPVGEPRIQFNAHRIYSYEQIVSYFPDLELKEFTLIPDNAAEIGIIENADAAAVKNQNYACGCFVFKK